MASRHLPVLAFLLAAAACVLATQSPIDIRHADAETTELPDITFKHYHSIQSTYYLENTGHGCQITLKNWLYNPRIKGGPLPKSFVLEQVHFHWGASDGKGSEHYIDGLPYSMEVHLVHWNSKYRSFSEAATKPDGLAVVGMFIEGVDNFVNPDFQKLVDIIPQIEAEGSRKVESNADLLTWLLPYLESNGYFTYHGSLTTPSYSENVIWIVYDYPVVIGKSQIAPFRAIENEHRQRLTSNFRALQTPDSVVDLRYVPEETY